MNIEFDAIYKPTGEHFNPYKIDFNNNIVIGNFDGIEHDWCIFSIDGLNGDAILRQYTGLKDKNNKMIYYKDFISDCDGKIRKVEFENGMFGCYESYLISYISGERVKKLEPLINYLIDGAEVVGNEFENKEIKEGE